MTVTATGIFPQAMRLASAVCTAAKTTYNDGANAVLLDTAAANGTEYCHIAAIPRATVTATQLQLYFFDGTNYWLGGTSLMPAYTMAQTTACVPTPLFHVDNSAITEINPLRLQSGWKLYCAIGVALTGGIVFNACAKDY